MGTISRRKRCLDVLRRRQLLYERQKVLLSAQRESGRVEERRRNRGLSDESSSSSEGDSDSDSDSGSDSDSDNASVGGSRDLLESQGLPDYSPLINVLSSIRYWEPRETFDKAMTVQRWFHQQWFEHPRVFRRHFRMSRPSFEALLQKIEGHRIFQNKSKLEQTPVRYQLAVFLYRLGIRGLGSSELHVASTVGISEGSVRNYTSRVLTVLWSLRREMIRWPTREEKEAHKQRVCAASDGIFSGCVGFVDGTFITLLYAPIYDWLYYYNRKSSYALNAMVVCTDKNRIIYNRIGDTSAVHDARVFDNSLLSLHPERFFSAGEYLIGDSAYTVNQHMITPFKKPRADTPDCSRFNKKISSQRTVIEHVFGLLKSRFPAITAVPVKIKDADSHQLVAMYFSVACVLHNFLLDEDDEEWNEERDINLAREHQEMVARAQADGIRTGAISRGRGKSDPTLREAILHCMVHS